MSRFTVNFRDGESLLINDIIIFEKDQVAEIRSFASDYTKHQLRKIEKYGYDLSYLSFEQKKEVISTKDKILSGKTSSQLLDDETIQVSLHSNERSLKRIGSDDRTIIISLVDRVKRADTVKKAQFKGYTTLSYTTLERNDSDEFILPISFMLGFSGKRMIKMITVAPKNVIPEAMEASIAELDPEMAEMLLKLKERLNKK